MYIMLYLGNGYPESINRVQDLTGRKVAFHEADLCNKDSLRKVTHKEPVMTFSPTKNLRFFSLQIYCSSIFTRFECIFHFVQMFKETLDI